MIKPKEKPKASILVALPSYDGRRCNGRALGELLQIRNLNVRTFETYSSLLALGFNKAWAAALNDRPEFFMMLHDDILPINVDWIQLMFKALTTNRASIVSVVSPIKTTDGMTSTAIETNDPWNPRRLTMTEIFEKPETWTEPGLLLNTGLMLIDFRQPWVDKAYFTINDRLIHKDGVWEPECQPEDWNFSRMAKENGATLYATRSVTIQHVGHAAYDNAGPWGTVFTDPKYVPQEITA